MSDNPYEQLGVTEDASFEEIQEAKSRLSQRYQDDVQLLEGVEAAYDAIIMDRLRMRQEGKIKVPERIRFPERSTSAPPQGAKPTREPNSPAWLQQLLDTPSRNDLLLSTGIYLVLAISTVTLFAQVDSPSNDAAAETQTLSLIITLGLVAGVYLLFRKEKRFGRGLAIALLALVAGIGLGALLAPIAGSGLSTEQFSTLSTMFTLWLATSFLR